MVEASYLITTLVRCIREVGFDEGDLLDSFTDQLGAYSDDEAYLVVWCLTRMVIDGLSARPREAALHAMAELIEWHPSALQAAHGVCRLDRSRWTASEVEYAETICRNATGS
ncbi:hypothetical protein O7605_30510 [Verrucosispora sp. WMMA2121]|uniref:hypothetical protein n=1 Tax=Verrucosispora sp. WMMA2121 TaxID=3015164 RepID=UPI0022B7382A|nr:hypothetical protein [Verrucosispora sp. WMMA2121]MCZ7423847.1 hypothetical protein [Verrucosispora sp. WMMA2121]